MNNRTNAIKKRTDTLAEYIVGRCGYLEAENERMRQLCRPMQDELTEYGEAFWKALRKTEGAKENGDGSISLRFKTENGGETIRTIGETDPLYPLAKILLKKYGKWRLLKK